MKKILSMILAMAVMLCSALAAAEERDTDPEGTASANKDEEYDEFDD